MSEKNRSGAGKKAILAAVCLAAAAAILLQQ